MSDIAIRAEHLGKLYHIGAQKRMYRTLRETLTDAALRPFRRLHGNEPKEKNTIWALDDVSFEIKQGEAVGIIGRNGAGKSTLLKILSRITWPTRGRVDLFGRVGSLLEVGTGFHNELTGRENIYLNGAILGMSRREIERKFDEIVAFSEIEKFLDTPVKFYSSGMYVRLAFAVAAHLEPEILLVDEVLAVGDIEFRKKCLGKMQDVSQVGRTVLFVSHDMGNISNLCSKTIWLDAGNIRSIGITRDIISQYVSIGTNQRGEISWAEIESAPGNEKVRLKAVRIKSKDCITADILIDNEIVIEVDYWNLKDDSILISNLHLRDKLNSFVLASGNLPSANLSVDSWVEKKRPRGLYRTICIIPASFLNNEEYSIDIGLVDGRHEWQIWEKNILAFTVHETGEMKKEYMGSWVGVVRPKLDWSTKRLNGENLE
jgi:lipopolysaccharide transport system ATP-binding protein